MINTNALILAGGKSSRFGCDKTLVEYNDFPSMTHFLFFKLSKIFSKVQICAKNQKFSPPLPILQDNFTEFAPIFVLANLDIFTQPVFIIPADMPNISQNTIIRLFNELQNNDASIAKSSNKEHFLCGFFHPKIAKLAQAQILKNDFAVHKLLKFLKIKICEFENNIEFININTKQDLQNALKNNINFDA